MKAYLTLAVTVLVPMPARAEGADYARDVQPLLARNCYSCHGPQKQRSGLRLDSVQAMRQGGNSGPALVPGQGAQSRLLGAVTGTNGMKLMPPRGPRLTGEEVALLRAWIDAGATAPPGETTKIPAARSSGHWAFRAPASPETPAVKATGWVRNPLDRFILARLEKEGLRPAPEADRVTLLRRVSLDLVGLPPNPREVDAFLADDRPDAYERVVERLLASPHYGERWARHWLDQARYADSNGYSIDAPRSIWKYRDWVLEAFNRDLPFDRFLVEQLAGDLLPGATPGQRVATGFHRNTQINQEGGIDEEQFRVEAIVDRVQTTGTVFLGLTLGCAQCHDHKFDPISQREYYQLFAFFNNADEPTLELPTPELARRRLEVRARVAELERRLRVLDPTAPEKVAAWEGKLTAAAKAGLPADVRSFLAIAVNGRSDHQQEAIVAAFRKADQARHAVGGLGNPLPFLAAGHVLACGARQALGQELARAHQDMPAIATTLVVQERPTPRVTTVHLGGDFLRKGAVVGPGVPAVLPPLPVKEKLDRLDLARWLVDPANPLTARVRVNRVWQVYFGTGLVETDNDFGTQGTPPSHPELLDWLAREFLARRWSQKALHRLVVTSATYRQASRQRADLDRLDPRNRLLGRQNRLRLDAEVIRDVALSASGFLSPQIGGPGVFPPQPAGVYNFTQVPRDWKTSVGPDRYRRGLYTYFWRSAPHPGLTVFDAPDATSSCTRRNRSNTPLQALTLLNDQAFIEFAHGLAERTLRECPSGDEARLTHAFRLCLGRPPGERERSALTRLLERERHAGSDRQPDRERAAWTAVARVLLNLDEFITRE